MLFIICKSSLIIKNYLGNFFCVFLSQKFPIVKFGVVCPNIAVSILPNTKNFPLVTQLLL